MGDETMSVPRASTGIDGLDAILGGGLPAGRPTLLTGGPGSGKTLLALMGALSGATHHGEPAVFATFDEEPEALVGHGERLGFPVRQLKESGYLAFLDMRVPPDVSVVGQQFNLEAVMVRLDAALKQVGGSRLVLDALDNLYAVLGESGAVDREISRLLDWTREMDTTTVVSAGTGGGGALSHRLEAYLVDCVITVTQRVENRLMTRLLRVAKFRGAAHATNEFPFLIDSRGVTIMPVTSAAPRKAVGEARLSTGVEEIDYILGGGLPEGVSVMLSGRAGTGKTSLASAIAAATAATGRRVYYLTFEQAVGDIVINAGRISIPLAEPYDSGRLVLEARSPVECGLEEHLLRLNRTMDELAPDVIIVDPVSSLWEMGDPTQAKAMLLRFLDAAKARGLTTVITELLPDAWGDVSVVNASSLIDVWLRLRSMEQEGEFIRLIHAVKARGQPMSGQTREFHITSDGLKLEEPYAGPGGMVYGSAKALRQEEEAAEEKRRDQEIEHLERRLAAEREADRARRETVEVEAEQRELELREHLDKLKAERERRQRTRARAESERK